jgi:hypothetical protein
MTSETLPKWSAFGRSPIDNATKILHMDSEGNVIKHKGIEHNFNKKPYYKHFGYYYTKIYEPNKLPDKINEYVSFEIIKDGVSRRYEYSFPIEKVLHYTFWDIMMGV